MNKVHPDNAMQNLADYAKKLGYGIEDMTLTWASSVGGAGICRVKYDAYAGSHKEHQRFDEYGNYGENNPPLPEPPK